MNDLIAILGLKEWLLTVISLLMILFVLEKLYSIFKTPSRKNTLERLALAFIVIFQLNLLIVLTMMAQNCAIVIWECLS